MRAPTFDLDYICVSGSLEGWLLEDVDLPREHFVQPVEINNGRYMPPEAPGYGIRIKAEPLRRYEYPMGME